MTTLQRRRSSRPSNTGSRNNGGDGGGENDAYTNSLPSSSNSNRRSSNNNNNSAAASSPNPIVSAWEARRRRKSGSNNKQTSDNYEEEDDDDDDQQDNNGNNRSRRRRNNKNGKKKTKKSSRGKDLPDEEYDPYDSDPGESYREHCERIQGESSKTCLAMPKFLKDGKLGSSSKRSNGMSQVGNDSSSSISNGNGIKTMVMNNGIDQNLNRSHNHDDKSGSTHPPSPFQSELDDMSPIQQRRRRSSSQQQGGGRGGGGGGLNPNNPLGHQQQFGTPQQSHQHSQPDAPASLPRDLARVRYSLRTSIGDGTDVQPGGSAAMMERRDLRPNNIHINVSHWSDFGGRNYMEDRYVIVTLRYTSLLFASFPYRSFRTFFFGLAFSYFNNLSFATYHIFLSLYLFSIQPTYLPTYSTFTDMQLKIWGQYK